jgi:hypothetical protein
MTPSLGGNCPACGTYNIAGETLCVCGLILSHAAPTATARPASRPRPLRLIALVGAALVVIGLAIGANELLITGPAVSLEVTPDFVSLAPAATSALRIRSVDARGHVITPVIIWTSEAGAIDASGNLIAPTKTGSFRVAATTENGLVAHGNVLVEPGPPSRVEVSTPGTIKPSESASLDATVLDSYGNKVIGAKLAWSVTPSGKATIDADGHFVTRTVGTYTVEARSDTAVGTTNVIVSCPQTHSAPFRGSTFSVVCGSVGDIWLGDSMSSSDTQTILATIDRDVSALEKELALQVRGRFNIFVYATSKTFDAALSRIFPGASGDVTGVFVPPDSIVVDWQSATSERPETTVRHELTHLLVESAAGRLGGRELPAWFNEGLATLEQYGVPGSEWQAVSDRYCAASAAATGTMPSLASMTANRDFQALNGRIGYFVGAQAVQFMKDDVGIDGLRKMLTDLAVGHYWDAAYLSASGKTWESFRDDFARRVKDLAPRYPGVAFASDTPGGPGVAYVVYGYAAGSSVRVNIQSGNFFGNSTHATDAAGCYYGYLGSTWPSGTYGFTATGGAGTVQSTLRK